MPFELSTLPCYLYDSIGAMKAADYVTDFSVEYFSIDNYVPVFFIFTSKYNGVSINKRYKIINEGISNNRSI